MKSKRTLQAFVGLALAFTLTACGGQTEIDPAQALSSMEEQLTFTDQLAQIDKSGACRAYGVEEDLVEDCAALSGSGATAESLSVWKAVDADSAEQIESQLQTFVDGYIEGYASYKPEEVPKLESAILSRSGVYVILCVSADNEAAQSVVEQALQS